MPMTGTMAGLDKLSLYNGLNLDDNQLSGPIPQNLTANIDINFAVGGNRLNGTIPKLGCWGNCGGAGFHCNLRGNAFSCPLPNPLPECPACGATCS